MRLCINYSVCSYLVTTLIVGRLCAQGSQLQDVVCAKNDWPGIKLAAAHDDLPPWAGRGDIPDGSKSYIPRLQFACFCEECIEICAEGYERTEI